MSFFKKKDMYKERYERLEKGKTKLALLDAEMGLHKEEEELRRNIAQRESILRANRPQSGVSRVLGDVGRGFERVKNSSFVQKANDISKNFEQMDRPIYGNSPKNKGKKKSNEKTFNDKFMDFM